MAKEFSITSKQCFYLQEALYEPLGTGTAGYFDENTCKGMVKRGWLKNNGEYWRFGSVYEITDLGRTVARQLGIAEYTKDEQP